MLSIWFMFSNHTFAKITGQDRETMVEQARDLFRSDGCGGLFVHDEFGTTLRALTLHGHRLDNDRYGVPASEVEKWADEIMAERSFRTLMA